MNKVKPRGPVPSLIGGTNGRPKRVTVQRKSTCSRCQTPWVAGESCIQIPTLGNAYSSSKRVCDHCFRGILRKTSEDLKALETL